MRTLQYLLLGYFLFFLLGSNAGANQETTWLEDLLPYRVRIALEHPVANNSLIEIDPETIIERVAEIAVDQLNTETFAFEKAVLVNPKTGKQVGRFQLVSDGDPLKIDGDFSQLKSGEASWIGFVPEKMSFKEVTLGNSFTSALMIQEEEISNSKVQQKVQLIPGQRYLLEYWFMMDAVDNEMGVMLYHPNHRIFAQVRHSYFNRMPPEGEWKPYRVIFRPETRKDSVKVSSNPIEVDLQIHHAFIGRGGVADLKLQPVKWQLVLEPDEELDEVDLYMVARAGHRLTVPADEFLNRNPPINSVNGKLVATARQLLNANSYLASDGTLSAWTVAPELPMKVGVIRDYKPEYTQATAARIDTFRGGSHSLVIAVDTGSPRLDELKVATNLPAEVKFHRLATIPVYDGPTVGGEVLGNHIETRYDAMVPLDYRLDADSEDGIHLIVATITPQDDTSNGVQPGEVTLQIGERTLTIPIEMRVAPLTLKPKRHFGSLFGAAAYLIARPKGVADMAEDSISIAEFHGLQGDDLIPRWTENTGNANGADSESINVRGLAERYFHTLLDNHLLPRSPELFLEIKYNIAERGDGLSPDLTDWDFSQGFDEALKEFVIGRDMPWLTVFHTNGHLMHKFRLRNGSTYSVEENPEDPNWIKLSREEFDRLIGDYFDALARHLDELGILDRALLVIDESGHETYDTIYAFVMALKARPYASQIKIGHTSYKVSTWTHRLPNGKLLMDEVLDVPMPICDEHFNFFEPEWNSRFKQPKIQWVYNVESDHLNLENGGLSSAFLPLRLQHLGVDGWYDWESFMWSLPYAYFEGERGGFKYGTGPVMNPWINPFYHHGPGVISFFYPPDPRGPAAKPTDLVIPSFRLTLMRDGIQLRSLLEALKAGRDDEDVAVKVDVKRLKNAMANLETLWPDNPVQWYLSYAHYRKAQRELTDLAMESLPDESH